MKRIYTFFLLLVLSFNLYAKTSLIIKSPLDKRVYDSIVLKNGLKVIVVSDSNAHTTACALVVHAGSFDEPKEHLGLAHYLEHMLFLGTKKFPTPDDFQDYVTHHGGNYNAMTENEKTTYFFNIQPQHIKPALERFSDFFMAPLFNVEFMDREIKSVDSEFHLYRSQDNHALYEVDKETSNPNHPFFRFSAGNSQTLKDKEKLYPAVRAFYKQHYHAQNMTLALVGPEASSTLIQYAQTYFSQIPTSSAHKVKRSFIYESAQLGRDISMRSRSQSRELLIQFPLTLENQKSYEKSGKLISMLLGYEGPGSLAAYLKKMQWISSISTHYEAISHEQNVLSFHFILTPLGMKHKDDITQRLFAYIEFLKQKGIPLHFFDELKTMSQWDFHFSIQENSMELALALADRLNDYPIQNILTTNFYLKHEALPQQEVQTLLTQLKPQHMRRILLSPDIEANRKSYWYNAAYKVEPLNEHQIKRFSHSRVSEEFSLPQKNIFLPEKLDMLQQTQDVDQPPEKIELEGITLWYHQNTHFQQPRSHIVLSMDAQHNPASSSHNLLASLYAIYAQEKLIEKFYPALFAGALMAVHPHADGLALSIQSYSDKQTVLLKQVLEYLKQLQITEADFQTLLNRHVANLKNMQHLSLYVQALSDLNNLLYSPTWHPQEMLQVSKSVSYQQFNKFAEKLWDSTKVDILVHGNVNKKNAIQIATILKDYYSHLNGKRTYPSAKRVVKLENNKIWYRAIPSADDNQVLVWYLQYPKTDYQTMAKTILLSKLMEAPFFQSLRTQQQLGYALQTTPFMLEKVSGLVLWIQSSTQPSQVLMNRTKTFFEDYQKEITQLTEADLKPIRLAAVEQLRQAPQSLDEEAQQLWAPIERGDYEFNRAKLLSDAIEKISLEELADFAKALGKGKEIGQLFVLSDPKHAFPQDSIVSTTRALKDRGAYFS